VTDRARRVALALHTLFLVAGCARPAGISAASRSAASKLDRTAVIFLVDGLSRPRLQQMLADEQLPNIATTFVRGGVEVKNAVESLPPITYANIASLLTGVFPGHHGILGNQWFDRAARRYVDYGRLSTFRSVNDHLRAATIYERLADQLTISVQCHTFRGVTHSINSNKSGIDWLFGADERVDTRSGRRVREALRIAHADGRRPAVLLFYFPGVDAVGHHDGPDSARYAAALRNVDRAIGDVLGEIRRAGWSAQCLFVLVTDHSHVQTSLDRELDLPRLLREQRGLTVGTQADQHRPPAQWDRFNCVVVQDGGRRAAIHLRGESGWYERPCVATVQRVVIGSAAQTPLFEIPGVALVSFRLSRDSVRLISRTFDLRVERREGEAPAEPSGAAKQYRVLAASKSAPPAPFDSKWHTSREWLERTASGEFPDLIPQIVEMFDSPHAGDLVVFADTDWSIGRDGIGAHGSALRADMHVPLYFSATDLANGASIDVARTVDLTPTVLDWLGFADRVGHAATLDGESLLGSLRSARP